MSDQENYKQFVHRSCEFWPCHAMERDAWVSCMFCFCPLFLLDCGGDFDLLPGGMKDCSRCTVPHREDGWETITGQIADQLFSANASKS